MKNVILGFTFLVGIGGTHALYADGAGPYRAIKPCVQITGAKSKLRKISYHRITNAEDWAELWRKHKGLEAESKYDFYYNPAGLPVVDFEHFMIVGIFQGSGWNSAGIQVDSITESESELLFRFNDKAYQTMGGSDKVTPFGFFVIPKSKKKLILEENAQGMINQPPIWKKRIHFEQR